MARTMFTNPNKRTPMATKITLFGRLELGLGVGALAISADYMLNDKGLEAVKDRDPPDSRTITIAPGIPFSNSTSGQRPDTGGGWMSANLNHKLRTYQSSPNGAPNGELNSNG